MHCEKIKSAWSKTVWARLSELSKIFWGISSLSCLNWGISKVFALQREMASISGKLCPLRKRGEEQAGVPDVKTFKITGKLKIIKTPNMNHTVSDLPCYSCQWLKLISLERAHSWPLLYFPSTSMLFWDFKWNLSGKDALGSPPAQFWL